MKYLEHPNITKVLEPARVDNLYGKDGSKLEQPYAVLELAQAENFLKLIQKTGSFSEPVARFYFKQLISTLEFMFEKNVCHRDIKPENMLLDSECNLKLTDFGFATNVKNKEGGKILHQQRIGTPFYMAPEILKEEPFEGDKADLYSAGITLFALLYEI